MTFKPAQCPNCGGALQLPDDRTTVNCMYCGISIVVREAIQAVALGNVKNWLQIADTAAESGNNEEAYAFYTRILEVEGHNPYAWLGKAGAAGRMSTLQNCRLLEMMTGIEKALNSGTPQQREELETTSGRIICSVIPSYYNSMRAQIMPHIGGETLWLEYINQIEKVAQALHKAHPALPKNEEIINLHLHLCRDHLDRKGIAFVNSATGYQNYRELPQEHKVWWQGKFEFYTSELRSLHPEVPLDSQATPSLGLLEMLERISTPVWIGIGVILVIFLALGLIVIVSNTPGRQPASTLSETSDSRKSLSVTNSQSTASPSREDSAQIVKTTRGLLSGSAETVALREARNNLREIPTSAPEYNEAQRLLGIIDARLNHESR